MRFNLDQDGRPLAWSDDERFEGVELPEPPGTPFPVFMWDETAEDWTESPP